MIYGQPYRISLELEMPESLVNKQLGMFMIKMSCYTNDGQTVAAVVRSVSAKVPSLFCLSSYQTPLLSLSKRFSASLFLVEHKVSVPSVSSHIKYPLILHNVMYSIIVGLSDSDCFLFSNRLCCTTALVFCRP